MSDQHFLTHEEFEAIQDKGASPDSEPTFGEVVQQRLGRRDILRGMLGTSAIAAFAPALPAVLMGGEAKAQAAGGQAGFGFVFQELARGTDAKHHVAPGYDADVLIRWGDPLFADSPDFDPYKQTAESQLKQFGYNCDFTAFYPLPQGSNSADHGLLWVNHEYTQAEMMFPGLAPEGQDKYPPEAVTKEIVDIEMAAHSGSIVEVKRGKDGKWSYVKGGKFNRRINALNTKMVFTGPAAGHARMKTKDDPDGRTVIGMLNNCAGGVTPWGTVLSGEENIDGYFMGTIDQTHPEQRNYDRMTVPSPFYQWGRFHERFNINKEPFAANHYGWIVEIDPFDPTSTPRKLTALGRFKHEGAGVTLNKDGRVIVYMGDDQRFEHVYRFVSKGKFNPADRKANMTLLDEGTLSVARFDADGTVTWLPLVHGQGPLTAANGFKDQGDVVIAARIAATLVGATRMDRPEDVEVNPKTGLVYVMLTNNDDRLPDDPIHPAQARPNAANPRPANSWGHIVEMTPPGGDHAAAKYKWEILIKAGNPADPKTGASFNKATTENGWFACPDNCAFDSMGRLWVGTDQGSKWQWTSGSSDGIWAVETQGPLRGTARLFFRVPVGAELTGPTFTPDDQTLFLSVQHPGSDAVDKVTKSGNRSGTFADPGTRWPDFKDTMPARPSVVVITKKGGGVIGV
ncbi:MAG: PhoX family protein [Niveispirillum sp.]|uniref:PhoX family protein n=1 Tax=Niveispirillum sp. TaxID=1917217 RepID=UPI003BA52F51